jgi:BlaI family penicillinase repressor
VRISDAESRIMEALWTSGPRLVEEIIAETAPAQRWSDATVKALIGRLLKKRAIESVREGGRTRYRPLVARDEYLATETQGLLDRLFGGELAPFVSHFAQHQKLKPADIARLKALLEALDDDN